MQGEWGTRHGTKGERVGMRVSGHVAGFFMRSDDPSAGYDELTHINFKYAGLGTRSEEIPARFYAWPHWIDCLL